MFHGGRWTNGRSGDGEKDGAMIVGDGKDEVVSSPFPNVDSEGRVDIDG